MTFFNTEQIISKNSPLLESRPTIQPALFTLIVYANDLEEYTYCMRAIHYITKKIPCKVLFGQLEQSNTSFFQKKTILLSSDDEMIDQNLRPTCLSIQASQDQLHRISFSFLPEILPDLPVYLLFQGAPDEKIAIFKPLLPYVTKILFSVSQIQDYSTFAHNILISPYIDTYLDLQWTQLYPWQEAFIRIFDDEKKWKQLILTRTLRICYSQRESENQSIYSPLQAIYFQAWLAQKLQWKSIAVENDQQKGRIFIRYLDAEFSNIEIEIGPSYIPFLENGVISSIELSTSAQDHYLMHYEKDDRHIIIHSSSSDRCEMPFILFTRSFQKNALFTHVLLQKSLQRSQYTSMLQAVQKISST